MKKNLSLFAIVISCSLALALCVVFIVTYRSEDVSAIVLPSDISDSFAANEITYLVSAGVLETQKSGEDALFFPQSEVTREYFVCTLVKLLDIDTDKYRAFDAQIEDEADIAEENLPLVRAALAVGIIEPSVLDGKSYFLPDEPVTREEAAHIMGALSNAVIATSKPEAFSDLDEADDEYIENLKKLIHLDVLVGYPDGTMKPKNNLTREEFALMLYRVVQSESF